MYEQIVEWNKHDKNKVVPFLDGGGEAKKAPKGVFTKASSSEVGLLPYYHLPKRTKGDGVTL